MMNVETCKIVFVFIQKIYQWYDISTEEIYLRMGVLWYHTMITAYSVYDDVCTKNVRKILQAHFPAPLVRNSNTDQGTNNLFCARCNA